MSHTCGYRYVQGRAEDHPVDHYREDGTCSYCGSVSQEEFLAFAAAGGELGPTDKDYKVYLNSTDAATAPGLKFYFYHLGAEGQKRFIDLYNDQRLQLGNPGHFYVLPFFCKAQPIQ